jgi:hypothetical protein
MSQTWASHIKKSVLSIFYIGAVCATLSNRMGDRVRQTPTYFNSKCIVYSFVSLRDQDTVPCTLAAWFCRAILWSSDTLQILHSTRSSLPRLERCVRRKCLLRSPGVWNEYTRLWIGRLSLPKQIKHIFGLFSLYTNIIAKSNSLLCKTVDRDWESPLDLIVGEATQPLNYFWRVGP